MLCRGVDETEMWFPPPCATRLRDACAAQTSKIRVVVPRGPESGGFPQIRIAAEASGAGLDGWLLTVYGQGLLKISDQIVNILNTD